MANEKEPKRGDTVAFLTAPDHPWLADIQASLD
jgi:hypothetical protein